jgi:chaperone required for assembly of F1-ATPase
VTLDSKKVKTPNGAVLTVENEGLALAVAHEWQARDEVVQVDFFFII